MTTKQDAIRQQFTCRISSISERVLKFCVFYTEGNRLCIKPFSVKHASLIQYFLPGSNMIPVDGALTGEDRG